jgi:hypothetical protein
VTCIPPPSRRNKNILPNGTSLEASIGVRHFSLVPGTTKTTYKCGFAAVEIVCEITGCNFHMNARLACRAGFITRTVPSRWLESLRLA